tara:strand:+ start:432 stop:1472 length:1041 start_codon:yes stop_codon:yes gene_type:complete
MQPRDDALTEPTVHVETFVDPGAEWASARLWDRAPLLSGIEPSVVDIDSVRRSFTQPPATRGSVFFFFATGSFDPVKTTFFIVKEWGDRAWHAARLPTWRCCGSSVNTPLAQATRLLFEVDCAAAHQEYCDALAVQNEACEVLAGGSSCFAELSMARPGGVGGGGGGEGGTILHRRRRGHCTTGRATTATFSFATGVEEGVAAGEAAAAPAAAAAFTTTPPPDRVVTATLRIFASNDHCRTTTKHCIVRVSGRYSRREPARSSAAGAAPPAAAACGGRSSQPSRRYHIVETAIGGGAAGDGASGGGCGVAAWAAEPSKKRLRIAVLGQNDADTSALHRVVGFIASK